MVQTDFRAVRRQQFRRYFQPSRVLLGLFPAPSLSGVNVITLCFNMHCSYDPPMIAVAINDRSSTYDLVDQTDEFVLSVPGESLARETMICGHESMRDGDKVVRCGLELIESASVSVPGLSAAIANIELRTRAVIQSGDHRVVLGEVGRFAVNVSRRELPLVSIGPFTEGYRVLCKKGMHRIGVVAAT